MSVLKGRGCRFVLDDFGSGLSSFSYRRNFPVDFIKIDGQFVRGIARDPIQRALVESINHVGHVMQMKTIAEWVEDDEILALTRLMNVDYVQGFGIARPRPLTRILEAERVPSHEG
jgi:EAL domain-containing protein (putative c-di-GMP-specific phosphodiesterase class I)